MISKDARFFHSKLYWVSYFLFPCNILLKCLEFAKLLNRTIASKYPAIMFFWGRAWEDIKRDKRCPCQLKIYHEVLCPVGKTIMYRIDTLLWVSFPSYSASYCKFCIHFMQVVLSIICVLSLMYHNVKPYIRNLHII